MVLLEVFVAVHATLITVYKANPIWPMFMVGFLVIFVLTQVHALTIPGWARWMLLVTFVAGVLLLYLLVRGVSHLYEITFIPVALYGGTIALWLVGMGVERVTARRNG